MDCHAYRLYLKTNSVARIDLISYASIGRYKTLEEEPSVLIELMSRSDLHSCGIKLIIRKHRPPMDFMKKKKVSMHNIFFNASS